MRKLPEGERKRRKKISDAARWDRNVAAGLCRKNATHGVVVGNKQFCEICNIASKQYNRKFVYGLSEEEYVKLHTSQDGLCANRNCLRKITMNTKGCHVDHDHKTGKVRGLLCNRCNLSLGLLEDGQLVQGLSEYIKRDAVKE